jgi:glycosyltransferase involved in cell wall biosynthesis
MHVAAIVPARNVHPEYLRRCIRSIERSRAKSRDVLTTTVISDDCSESSLSSEYQRLALEHCAEYVRNTEWGGIGGARNLGVAHIDSEATHLMFVDADDEIDDDCIASIAIPESNNTIITGLCRVIGRGRPHITKKAGLLDLIVRRHGSRTSPLLYTNAIGQPALLPMAAFKAVNGYAERRYSGEHVDLWGRLMLGDEIRRIVLVPKVLYRYYSRPDGNYRRDEPRHRREVAEALSQLVYTYFNDVWNYAWAARGRSLPSLYVPTDRSGNFRMPPWADYDNRRWRLKNCTVERFKIINFHTELYFDLDNPELRRINNGENHTGHD